MSQIACSCISDVVEHTGFGGGGEACRNQIINCQGASQSLDVGNGKDSSQDMLSSAEFHIGYVSLCGLKNSNAKNSSPVSKLPTPNVCLTPL